MSNYILAEITEKVKQAIPIETIMAEDGINLKQQGRELVGYHSNKHKSISKASLQVNPAKQVYICRGCGEGGDVFTWLMLNRDIDFMSALCYMAAKTGIEMPDVTPEEQQKQNKRRQEQEKLHALYTAGAEEYHEQLKDEHYEMLNSKWGLSRETAESFKFGFAPGGKFLLQKLKEKGFDEELVKRSGLINKGGYDFFHGRLVFPYWKSGKVVYFIARRIDGVTPDTEYEKAKFKKLLVHSENTPHISEAVSNEYFCGEDTARRADELLITEGIADCYAAIQAGFNCISPATVQFREADFPRLAMLAKKAETYICNDAEKNLSGEKGAFATAEYLEEQGINVKLVQLPRPEGVEKIDLADFLKEHTAENFLELMRQAKTLTELAIKKLENNPVEPQAQREAASRAARLNGIEADTAIENIFQALKPLKISKQAIRDEIAKLRKKDVQEEDNDEKETQADTLIKIATKNAFLFHDETRDGFASLEINGHREIHALNSKFFKRWIVRQYYEQTGHSPSSEAVRQALGVTEAKAVFDGPEYKLHLRVAEHDGAVWYDLANDKWQAVKITPDGWEVLDNPPILFRRFKNTAPQVLPEKGGSLELQRKYINFKNNSDWLLSDACDATSLISGVPHPISISYGDKGSAKTTAQRVKRKILDPAYRDTMLLPTDKNELALMLMTNYAPIFDNLDGLQPWQSDMLCQAATGGGISKRELYTDIDEVILSFMRCPMLNGINLVASRDDLLDRSLLFKLERIDEESRMEETEFWREFEKDRPYILGALFDAVAAAMRVYPSLELKTLPRMADFARWGYAVNQAINGDGEAFLEAYFRNIAGAVEEAVLSEQVSAAVIDFMSDKVEWEGTATELLKMLSEIPGVDTKAKSWPKRPHTLTKRLNNMKAALADYGIICETWRKGSGRSVSLRVKNKASQASQASEPRENGRSSSDAYNDAKVQASPSVTQASPYESRKNGHCDGSDANDACFGTPGGSASGYKKK